MTTNEERMLELACDRALVGLTPDGQAELEAFLGAKFDGRALDLEIAAAAIQLSQFISLEAPPARVAERALASAGSFFAAHGATALMPENEAPRPRSLSRGPMPPAVGSVRPPPGSVPPPNLVPLRAPAATVAMAPEPPRPAQSQPLPQPIPLPTRDRFRFLGWIAAAACLALAIGTYAFRTGPIAGNGVPSATPSAESPIDGRAALLARAGDVVRANWSEATDPTGHGVSGDVVWSNAEQKGYMRFHGLAANDRAATAYQLWIFDAKQDEKFPVDGGVFDVDASTGDVIVPITAKLKIQKPTLFAVTIEKPGGVVVSKRDRLVVTASVAG
jgi:hypothetical protein